MKKVLIDFYNDIAKKKTFWIPLLIFVLSAYAFGMLNRTLSWDDLGRDKYVGEGNVTLAGRWGMDLWAKLTGTLDLNPFTDRYLAAFFLTIASILACVVLYKLSSHNKVWPYTIVAASIITYPLINEIWEYTMADYISCGNQCLVTLALLYLLCGEEGRKWKECIIASLLLLLPTSSYESAIFYYITFVSLVIFYKEYKLKEQYTFLKILKEGVVYCLPLVIAVALRFAISFIINHVLGLSYNQGGATTLYWDFSDIFNSVKMLVLKSGFFYGIVGLVYFPITVFVISMFAFIGVSVAGAVKKKRLGLIGLGALVLVAIFFQAIVQGDSMPYRTATLSLALFVAFVSFLLCEASLGRKLMYLVTVTVLMLVCWHQSVYLNKIQSLNNLRSDNELAALRHMGYRLESEYDGSKPVVFVTSYTDGDWLKKRCTVSSKTWNGRLFLYITQSLMGGSAVAQDENGESLFTDFKYIQSNLNCFTGYYTDIEAALSYLGFRVNILSPTTDESRPEYKIFEEALQIAQKENMTPYSIIETDNYIIATLSNSSFFDKYGYQ